jgi:N-acetylmuramoyl-L-alanine amidase
LIVTPDEPTPMLPPPEGGQPGLPTVVVDPGHGGKDDGTKWRGLAEKDLTLDVGLRLDRLLKVAGFPTVLTRRDDVFVPLSERVRLANQYGDAVFVSIHFNSDPGGSSSGIQTHFARHKDLSDPDWAWAGLFAPQDPAAPDTSESLAGAIQTSATSRTEARNRGVYENDFYVIHHTKCPAALVEGGFVSNAFEAQLLRNDEYRERLAQGIAEGVMAYVKSRPRPPFVPARRIAEAIR